MNWGSWNEFFAMGGYAFYVWGSYLVTLGLIIAEIALLALRKGGALERLRAHGARAPGPR
jgi:heme exporter protein D